jgi:hypothetical protein
MGRADARRRAELVEYGGAQRRVGVVCGSGHTESRSPSWAGRGRAAGPAAARSRCSDARPRRPSGDVTGSQAFRISWGERPPSRGDAHRALSGEALHQFGQRGHGAGVEVVLGAAHHCGDDADGQTPGELESESLDRVVDHRVRHRKRENGPFLQSGRGGPLRIWTIEARDFRPRLGYGSSTSLAPAAGRAELMQRQPNPGLVARLVCPADARSACSQVGEVPGRTLLAG